MNDHEGTLLMTSAEALGRFYAELAEWGFTTDQAMGLVHVAAQNLLPDGLGVKRA